MKLVSATDTFFFEDNLFFDPPIIAYAFNVPVQAPTQGQPFYTVIPRNRPI